MTNVAHNPATRNTSEDTGEIPVLFGSDSETARLARPSRADRPDYVAIQRSPEFTALRDRFRRFVFPMSVLFVVWYLVYVLLAAYAHDFMSIKVFGEINIAIVMGILQFVSTAAITVAYLRFAKHRLDPEVEAVRRQAGV